MVTRQKSLYELFADYDEERLLQILTVDRAVYRPEALAAAEMVLTARGVALPTFFPDQAAPPAGRQAQGSYQLSDLGLDASLLLLGIWGWTKLWEWTAGPNVGGALGDVAYWVLTYMFLCSVYSLRQKWRANNSRD